ncbi:MAG: hypothetical protein HYX43_21475 [Burkholderiales bacterium]|nr:hypothetical protein [Burkholderiales bacterium]
MDNSAPFANRPESTYKSGKTVQTNGATSVTQLPHDFYALIGEISMLWALQEWMLAGCICRLLGVDRKRGRIAVGTPRIDESVKRITQLLRVANKEVATDIAALKKRLKDGEESRDLLDHAVWLQGERENEYQVQNTRGVWDTGAQETNVPKILYPEAKDITKAWLLGKRELVASTIQDTEQMYREIEAALTS